MVLSFAFGVATMLHNSQPVEPAKAIEILREGNKRFISGSATHSHQDEARRLEVAKGQKPLAIVLTCADSRVSPEVIFDQGLGDLFVLRVAGNIAEPATMASIEYAVDHLDAHLLVVMGHERCGAVKAAVDTFGAKAKTEEHGHGHATASFLPGLIGQILPSVKQAKNMKGDLLDNSIANNVINTANKVANSQPLKDFVDQGKLTVMGSVYDLDSGVVKNIFLSKPGKPAKAVTKAAPTKAHH